MVRTRRSPRPAQHGAQQGVQRGAQQGAQSNAQPNAQSNAQPNAQPSGAPSSSWLGEGRIGHFQADGTPMIDPSTLRYSAMERLGPLQGRILSETGENALPPPLPTRVPGAIPGEQVRFAELGRGAHQAMGKLLRVLEPHPDRIEPVCTRAGVCGSCDRMHLRLPAQHHFKQRAVEQALAGLVPSVQPLVESPRALGYRRRARFVFGGRAGRLTLGAWQAGSHTLIDVGDCPVTAPVLLQARDRVLEALEDAGLAPYDEGTGLGVLRALILQTDEAEQAVLALLVVTEDQGFAWERLAESLLERQGKALYRTGGIHGVGLNLHTERGNALQGFETRALAGKGALRVKVGNLKLEVPLGAFSQVNLEVAGRLYQDAACWALEPAPGEVEVPRWGPQPPEGGLLDLYCGVGALGLHVSALAHDRARPFAWGLGLETHPGAVSTARWNARRLGCLELTFQASEVHEVLKRLVPDVPLKVVLVNPPRGGLESEARVQLLRLNPPRILYVSCSPQSLARDLKILRSDYEVVRVQPYDMFPQTHHVETLVWLQRRTTP